jgi:hypothetical protein
VHYGRPIRQPVDFGDERQHRPEVSDHISDDPLPPSDHTESEGVIPVSVAESFLYRRRAVCTSEAVDSSEPVGDERVDRADKAERLLEAIGTLLLESSPPADELWPITAFSLASHARSHHRALLEGLAGQTPRASQIHARPIVETAILIHCRGA